MASETALSERGERLLRTLQRLLSIDAVALVPALNEAATEVAEALAADKVDVFLYERERHSLQAFGASATPMAAKQFSIGMDRLPLVNGGLAVEVFNTGRSIYTGHADRDGSEIKGLVEGLGIRSEIIAPLQAGGERRGVLQVLSAQEDYFDPREDVPFVEAVSRWIGLLVHRAELVERLTREAMETGRREATESMLKLLTPRQREIAELISAGLTNEQIANRLFLSAGSVANHVERILQKLGAARRTQIASWIAEARIQLLLTDGDVHPHDQSERKPT